MKKLIYSLAMAALAIMVFTTAEARPLDTQIRHNSHAPTAKAMAHAGKHSHVKAKHVKARHGKKKQSHAGRRHAPSPKKHHTPSAAHLPNGLI